MDIWSDSLRLASLVGATEMIAFYHEPQFYVMCITAITVAGGLIMQVLKNKQETRRLAIQEARYERDRLERLDHQDELRLDVARTHRLTASAANQIKDDLRENTELTREGIAKTQQFADVANHVNDKFVTLARVAVASLNPELATLAADTNQTVHKIDDKVEAHSA